MRGRPAQHRPDELQDGVLHASAGAEERDPLGAHDRQRREHRPAVGVRRPGHQPDPVVRRHVETGVGRHPLGADGQHRPERVELQVAAVAAAVTEECDAHAPSLASSSSTIAGSSLVKIGAGFSIFAPTVTGRDAHGGVSE